MTGKKYDVENLGHTVKMLRINRKISQILLAEKLGISQTYLSNLEHGRGIFSLKMLVTIAEIFDISMDELLSGFVWADLARQYAGAEQCLRAGLEQLLLFLCADLSAA